MLLELQRTLGNQRVVGLIAGGRIGPRPVPSATPVIVQRASSGLAAATLTNSFAGTVLAYWRDAANKDKPLSDLGDYLIAEVNKQLATLGSYACNSDSSATGNDSGAFTRGTWTIEMNPAAFTTTAATKVGDMTQQDVAGLVDTIYHEARHSEQYFRIARIQAGEGKTAKEIEAGMTIPTAVASAAFAAPLKGDTKANKKLIEEAGAWTAFTVGKYETYKGQIASLRDATSEVEDVLEAYDAGDKQTTWDALTPKIDAIQKLFDDFFDTTIVDIGKIKKKDAADKTVLKDLKAIKKAWLKLKAEAVKNVPDINKLRTYRYAFYEARYNAYMDYEHEKDAWATGGAAGKAFNKAAKTKKK